MLQVAPGDGEEFYEWLGDLPHRHKLIGYGNHEFAFESDTQRRALIDNATVQLNEVIEIDGLRTGAHLLPRYTEWPPGLSPPKQRARHWARIPTDTNVLVTYRPSYCILDRTPGQEKHKGHPELLESIERLPGLRLHVFGHNHGAFGIEERDGVHFCARGADGLGGELEHQGLGVLSFALGRSQFPASLLLRH